MGKWTESVYYAPSRINISNRKNSRKMEKSFRFPLNFTSPNSFSVLHQVWKLNKSIHSLWYLSHKGLSSCWPPPCFEWGFFMCWYRIQVVIKLLRNFLFTNYAWQYCETRQEDQQYHHLLGYLGNIPHFLSFDDFLYDPNLFWSSCNARKPLRIQMSYALFSNNELCVSPIDPLERL